MIDNLDCYHHFLLVEGVRHHLSLVAKTTAKTQYTTPPWCHREAGVKLQSPSSSCPSTPSSIVDDRAPAGWRERPLIILVRPHIGRIECSCLLSTACNWLVTYFAIYMQTVWGVHREMFPYMDPLSLDNCTNYEKQLFWNTLEYTWQFSHNGSCSHM